MEIYLWHPISLSHLPRKKSVSLIPPSLATALPNPSTKQQGRIATTLKSIILLYRWSDHNIRTGPRDPLCKIFTSTYIGPHQNTPYRLDVNHRRWSPRPILPSDRLHRIDVYIHLSVSRFALCRRVLGCWNTRFHLDINFKTHDYFFFYIYFFNLKIVSVKLSSSKKLRIYLIFFNYTRVIVI